MKTKVGFTNDGLVFLQTDTNLGRGLPPARITLSWGIQETDEIIKKLSWARDECRAKADPPNIHLVGGA